MHSMKRDILTTEIKVGLLIHRQFDTVISRFRVPKDCVSQKNVCVIFNTTLTSSFLKILNNIICTTSCRLQSGTNISIDELPVVWKQKKFNQTSFITEHNRLLQPLSYKKLTLYNFICGYYSISWARLLRDNDLEHSNDSFSSILLILVSI